MNTINPKINKLRTELDKNKAKITELQEKNRGIERQIRELEDFSIVGLVRESGMTLEQFAALFATLKDMPLPAGPRLWRQPKKRRIPSMRKIKPLACLLAAVLCMTGFSTVAYAGGGDYYDEEPLPTVEPEEPAIEEGEPLSEETEFFTRDLLYDKHTNKQFITVQDRDGNLFYIVIDYDAPVNEEEEQYQTYFLNAVDVADLEALTEDGDEEPPACSCTDKCVVGDINTSCEICAANMSECAGKAPEPEPEPVEPEEPVEEPDEGGGIGGVLVVILLLAAGGGAAFYFLKVKKNKPQTRGSDDLDEYDYGEDEEDEDEYGDDPDYETEDEEA